MEWGTGINGEMGREGGVWWVFFLVLPEASGSSRSKGEHSTSNLKTFKVHAEMDAGKIQYSAWAQLQGSQGK